MSSQPPYALLRAELKHAKELNAELLAALDRIVQLNDKLPEEHPSRLSHGEYEQACAALAKAKAQP